MSDLEPVTPLYAHPAPPADLVELVEVCRRILDRGYISASIAEERDDYIALHNALRQHIERTDHD